MSMAEQWPAFLTARAAMLNNRGPWRAEMAEALRGIASAETGGDGHRALLARTSRALLDELEALPPSPSARERLAFFERSYRFTRIGQRIFS